MGEVIQGWDEAFMHMRKGDKRTLVIPYWLAYGVKGRPPAIPPRAIKRPWQRPSREAGCAEDESDGRNCQGIYSLLYCRFNFRLKIKWT